MPLMDPRGLCSHGQNPDACLTCWRAAPPEPAPKALRRVSGAWVPMDEEEKREAPWKGVRVVHRACGCRYTRRWDEVVSGQGCRLHPDVDKNPGWHYEQQRDNVASWEHELYEPGPAEGQCEDQRCQVAATRRTKTRTRRETTP
jgi:hypothetical protein